MAIRENHTAAMWRFLSSLSVFLSMISSSVRTCRSVTLHETNSHTLSFDQQILSAPSLLRVVDVQRDDSGSDFVLLVKDETEGVSVQRWIPRMELCSTDGGRRLVLDAFKWLNGLKPNPYTCCVARSSNTCLVVGEENAVAMETPHLHEGVAKTKDAHDISNKLFVGTHSTWYACPEGFAPLLFEGPFGGEDTCCSFFQPGEAPKEATIENAEDCGAYYCSKRSALKETGFCDEATPVMSKSVASKIVDDITSGPEGESPGVEETEPNSCVLAEDTPETKSLDVLEYAEMCKEKNDANRDGSGDPPNYCAMCRRQREGGMERKCTSCSRTRRASQNGWSCLSFGPEFPCGGKMELPQKRAEYAFKAFTKQFKGQPSTEWETTHNSRNPTTEWELLTDFNDGAYRQGNGDPGDMSSVRHHLRHRSTEGSSRHSTGEALGSCPRVTRLKLEQGRDEPLQASAEDFSSDRDRLKEVLMGFGTQSGLQDVRSVLYPRVSAMADFTQPNEVAYSDAARYHFSCSDSRSTEPILGTPGGDLAEFLLAMNVLELAMRNTNRPYLSDEIVVEYFQQYLEEMPEASGKTHFFMCSDEPSMALWARSAQVADPMNPRGIGEITRLISYGAMQNHVGSAHLRSMMQHPAKYRCRRGLVQSVVKAFLTVYYDVSHPSRGRLMMGTHDGDYARGNILYVDRSAGYPCGDQAPLVTPVSTRAVQSELFVVHRAAVDIYREHLARFVNQLLRYPASYEAEIFQSMRDIGLIQLRATEELLLPGVEKYVASFMAKGP